MLSAERQLELVRLAKAGNRAAANELVATNTPLAQREAGRVCAAQRYICREDALQVALIGVWQAINSFDERRGAKFSTHAYWIIRQHLLEFRRKQKYQYRQNHQHAEDENGELVHEDEFVGREPEADAALIFAEDSARLDAALAKLTPRQMQVICARYGLRGQTEQTLEQVGEQLGLSKERTRQIEMKAIDALKTHFGLWLRRKWVCAWCGRKKAVNNAITCRNYGNQCALRMRSLSQKNCTREA